MHDIIVISVPVILAAMLAVLGALFLELKDHRDRLVRIETLISLLPCKGFAGGCDVMQKTRVGPAPGS